jgi:hypothetical protein
LFSLANRAAVDVEIALSSFAFARWLGECAGGKSGARLVASDPHEVFPLRTVRPASLAVHLVNGDMGELVAESFFEDRSRRFQKVLGDPDEPTSGIAATQAPRHPGAELNIDTGIEAGKTPPRRPVGQLFLGPGWNGWYLLFHRSEPIDLYHR